MIDALEDTLMALAMVDKFANFTVGDLFPLHMRQTDYIPNVPRKLYRWGFDCIKGKKAYLSNFILPPADKMATAVTADFINCHMDTAQGRICLHTLYSSMTAAGIDDPNHHTEAALTTDGLDGVNAIAMDEADANFKDTQKAVLSLTPPLSLLYFATTLKKITIHLTPDPINSWL
jgi:hypothetical protein